MKIFLPPKCRLSVCILLMVSWSNCSFAIDTPPWFSLSQKSQLIEMNWGTVGGAEGYKIYYAPYPGGAPINSIDIGNKSDFKIIIGTCVSYYVAVVAYKNEVKVDADGNIELDADGNEILVYEESGYSEIKVVKEINPSFFPVYSCAGVLSSNSWSYTLNNGEVLLHASELVNANIAFNAAKVSVNAGTVQLEESFSATYLHEFIEMV